MRHLHSTSVALFLALGALGCGSAPPQSDPASSGRATETAPETTADGSGFIVAPDGGVMATCTFSPDDCPSQQKCSVFDSDDNGRVDTSRCVPVATDPGHLGDPCELAASADSATNFGFDDCDRGLACWHIDEATGVGRCVATCELGDAMPCTDSEQACLRASGALQVCVGACNPLVSDCPEGKGCYPVDGWLLCLPDASGTRGALADPCGFTNVCDPGLLCVKAARVPGCATAACCTTACDLREDVECPLPGQICDSYFDALPPSLEHVGICTL